MIVGMYLILLVGAYCDHKCNEVPDYVTVPYVYLGIVNALNEGRYALVCVLLVIVNVIQFDVPLPFIDTINRFFLQRLSQEELDTQEAIDDTASEFYKKNNIHIFIVAIILYVLTGIFALMIECPSLNKTLISLVLFAWPFVVELLPTKNQSAGVSAIGGADILALLGLFGLYGLIGGLYAVTVCMVVILIMYLLRRRQGGFAMLPYMAIGYPIAAWSVYMFAGDVETTLCSAISWLRLF